MLKNTDYIVILKLLMSVMLSWRESSFREIFLVINLYTFTVKHLGKIFVMHFFIWS